MQSKSIFLILIIIIISLSDNYSITPVGYGQKDSQDKDDLSKIAERYYSLAEDSYYDDPDSCMYYTLNYLEACRELGDKTKYADALYWTSDIYFYYNLDSAQYYGDKYLELAKELNDTSWIAYGYYLEGNIYCEKGMLDRSLYSLMKALQYFEQLKDTANISTLHNNIGYTLTYGSSQVEGMTHFLKSLELAEMINDTLLIGDVSTNLAYYFATTDDLDNAYKYSERSLTNTSKLGDSLSISIAYVDMAKMFLAMDEAEVAKAYIDSAQYFRPGKLSPFDKVTVYSIFADFYLKWEKPDEAELFLQELGATLEKHFYPIFDADYKRQKGMFSFQIGNYQEAISFFDASIAQFLSMNAVEGLVDLYRYKAESYSKINEFRNAYRFSYLSDSVRKSFDYGGISQLLARREKEIELKRQMDQDRIAVELESVKMKSRFIIFLVSSILLIISFSIAIYSALRLKRKNLILEELHNKNLEQQKRLEENLSELNENKLQLTSLIATKDRLFSIIGHDLGSPLSVISRLTDVYLKEGKSFTRNDIQPLLEGLKSAADYGNNLLENLLQWSLSNTGDLVASPEIIKPADIIKEVISWMDPIVKQKDLKFSLALADGCIAYADPTMVSTIIRNLVHNAIKFSHHNGIISLKCRLIDNEVHISIEDEGIGMPEDVKISILESNDFKSRFGTNKEKGSGLGLILCKEFIEQNNGKLWLSSEENKGSVFSFSLPVPK